MNNELEPIEVGCCPVCEKGMVQIITRGENTTVRNVYGGTEYLALTPSICKGCGRPLSEHDQLLHCPAVETSELPEHLRDPFQVIERGNQILKEWGCDADEAPKPGCMGDINGPGCDPDTP